MVNKCPSCGKENIIEIKQAARTMNCDARILFNILKVVCMSCRHEYYTSVSPVMRAKMEEKNKRDDID